jgi:hypothetical protein
MRKDASLFLIVEVAAGSILGGCIILRDDRGLHKGQYKQVQKEKR